MARPGFVDLGAALQVNRDGSIERVRSGSGGAIAFVSGGPVTRHRGLAAARVVLPLGRPNVCVGAAVRGAGVPDEHSRGVYLLTIGTGGVYADGVSTGAHVHDWRALVWDSVGGGLQAGEVVDVTLDPHRGTLAVIVRGRRFVIARGLACAAAGDLHFAAIIWSRVTQLAVRRATYDRGTRRDV